MSIKRYYLFLLVSIAICLNNNMYVVGSSAIKLKFDVGDHHKRETIHSTNDKIIKCETNFLIRKQLWPISRSHTLLHTKDLNCVLVNKKMIFTLTSDGIVTAINRKIGNTVWKNKTHKNTHNCNFKNSMVYEDHIIVIKSFLNILALSAEDGNILWNYKIQNPSRLNPVIKNRKVFIKTINNTLEALCMETGKIMWKHKGTLNKTHILDLSQPIITPALAIVTYNSGEIFALRSDNGCEIWTKRIDTLKNFGYNNIVYNVAFKKTYKNNILYIVSSEGLVLSININTGKLIWEREITGEIINNPVVLKKILLIPLKTNKLVCLASKGGYILWIKDFNNKSHDNKSFFLYNKITITNKKIILVVENKYIVILSPYNGNDIYKTSLPKHINTAPIIYDNYVLIYNKFNFIEYEL
jgi:outer membrane protein assembly factor BamB